MAKPACRFSRVKRKGQTCRRLKNGTLLCCPKKRTTKRRRRR